VRVWRRLEISPGFVALLSGCAYFGSHRLLGVFGLAALWHELGHVAALKGMGKRMGKLRLSLVGAELTLAEGEHTTLEQDIWLSLSGPAANLLAALICGLWAKNDLMAGANLLLGFFNLMPVLPLDGGCALSALLERFLDPQRALALMRLSSRLTALTIAALGVMLACRPGGQPWLALMGLWLLIASFSR
jgi:Zn-dependent protease